MPTDPYGACPERRRHLSGVRSRLPGCAALGRRRTPGQQCVDLDHWSGPVDTVLGVDQPGSGLALRPHGGCEALGFGGVRSVGRNLLSRNRFRKKMALNAGPWLTSAVPVPK